MGNDVTPRTIVDNLGPELLSSLGASISQISSTGHVVLGSPIGSNEHITAFAEHAIDEARRILRLISSLLLDRDSTGAPNTDVRKVAALPLALGGARLLPFGHTPPAPLSNPPINQSDSALTYHHASFFASWSSTWSRVRAWVPPLREETFPSVSITTHNSPPLPPFKAQVLDSCLAINLAFGSARLQSHPQRACLPSHYIIPPFFHPLLDGENMPFIPDLTNPPQLTANNSSSNHPCRLIPPSLLNFQSPSKVQAVVSSLVASLAFLDECQTASDTGKVRLLDGSTQHGPSAWHVRMPESERFRYFEQGSDPISDLS